MKQKMETFIYKLDEKIFEGIADNLVLPGTDGELTILKDHAPLIARLKSGVLKIKSGNQVQEVNISGGTIQVENNRLVGLVK